MPAADLCVGAHPAASRVLSGLVEDSDVPSDHAARSQRAPLTRPGSPLWNAQDGHGYNHPPQPSFCIGHGMAAPPVPDTFVTG